MSLAKELRQFVIEPTLNKAGWITPSDHVLIYGTGWVESDYIHVMQIGTPKNGGVGFFDDEPSDYKDIYTWLRNGFNRNILDRILSICNFATLPTDISILASNLAYATLICRTHYHRVKEPVPAANDALGMATYHKNHYNSSLGKADIEKNTAVWQRIINGEL